VQPVPRFCSGTEGARPADARARGARRRLAALANTSSMSAATSPASQGADVHAPLAPTAKAREGEKSYLKLESMTRAITNVEDTRASG